ncbi:hypothetical protein PENTCL1PPCAC_15194 [Pristionchus entomophagus]|uniref:DUF4781 domain-containing protein n=1 Tax=Pristionchus entomophagus TaxID=358040 RepID=A0AAV5TCJ6_9BILA|nr:hypothetical protein PENTCL1PPCAC_15194 [Pristionchus entomophagus]
MGNTWTQDTRKTWENEDVKLWKDNCWILQKQYYNGYEGAQFHRIDCSQEGNVELLTAKICFALFGMPTEADATSLLDGYTSDQQKDAIAFVERICELYKLGKDAAVEIMPLFICCKSNQLEYTLPIFRLRLDDETIKYLDTFKRVYKSWQDWQDNNKFPMMKYCFPTPGFYSCSEVHEKYNENESPRISFGTSPACDVSARVASTLDVSSMITSFGSAGIIIAGMFTPLAPVILVGGTIAGLSGAAWGTTRSVQRLVDKGQHGESLSDLESVTSWLAIALMPLSVATSAVKATLTSGARVSGRIFSSTVRTAATILNCTTLGLQSGMIVLGLANLVQKAKNKQLTPLDVLQYSMTIFFFTNTVMQPKTASGIIAKAQSEHIQQYRESMTDDATRSTFERYLNQNKGDGGIQDTSKIVRNLNKIDNPDQVFRGLADVDSIAIGGRKGNTLIIAKDGETPIRVSVKSTATTSSPLQSNQMTGQQRNQLDETLDPRKRSLKTRVPNIEEMDENEAKRHNESHNFAEHGCDGAITSAGLSISGDLGVENIIDVSPTLDLGDGYRGEHEHRPAKPANVQD